MFQKIIEIVMQVYIVIYFMDTSMIRGKITPKTAHLFDDLNNRILSLVVDKRHMKVEINAEKCINMQ